MKRLNRTRISLRGIAVGLAVLMATTGCALSTTTAGYEDVTHARSEAIGVDSPVFQPGLPRHFHLGTAGMALGLDGNVYAWGYTGSKLIGDSSNGSDQPATKVAGLPAGKIRQLAAGGSWANALDADGYVWGWGGSDSQPQTMNGTGGATRVTPQKIRIGTAWNGTGPLLDNVVMISTTYYAGVAVRTDGTVWHWGSQETYGAPPTGSVGAVKVSGLPNPTVKGNRPLYVKGAVGNFFVVLENGDVYAWGGSDTLNSLPGGRGALGATATLLTELAPWSKRNVAAGSPYIVAVDGGDHFGAALLSNGSVVNWGDTTALIGGRATSTPKTPALFSGISDVKVMQFSDTGVMFIKKDSSLWAYSGSSNDVAGLPGAPAKIDSNVVAVTNGQQFYIWQRADGTFWGRGRNLMGAIGLPSGSTLIKTNRQISFNLSVIAR